MIAHGAEVAGEAAARDETATGDRQWLYFLLPTVPLLLLMLRIWHFSNQNIDTTQLVIQDINPIGLIAALLMTLAWVLPAAGLVVRLAGSLLRISVDDPLRFRVARISIRIPLFVLLGSVILAAFTWEIQFLPILLMLLLMLGTVELKLRFPARAGLVSFCMLAVGVGAIVLFYVLCWPMVQEATVGTDILLIRLLGLLPPLGLLVQGPLPTVIARGMTNVLVVAFAVGLSAIVVLEFVRIPILPVMAVEVLDSAQGSVSDQVLSGYIISMDERMMTFLDLKGALHFVSNDSIVSKTLCRDYSRAPYTDLTLRGRNIEESVLEASGLHKERLEMDQRCYGRAVSAKGNGKES
jgi:hypothetical protein